MKETLVFAALILAGISILLIVLTAVMDVIAVKFFFSLLGILLVIFGLSGIYTKYKQS